MSRAATPADPTRRARALRAAGLLAAVTIAGLAALFLPADAATTFAAWLERVGDSRWAVPAALLAFVALAFVGAPQVVLITAMVAAFGPWLGFAYSWTAKLISCAAGFVAGRRFGGRVVREASSPALARTMAYLARRGFWASALIRIVPTVPSVVVNLAAGCTPIRFRDYIAGTALGSIPKMALTAFAGQAFIEGLKGGGYVAWAWLGVAIALMAALALVGRAWMRRAGLAPPPTRIA